MTIPLDSGGHSRHFSQWKLVEYSRRVIILRNQEGSGHQRKPESLPVRRRAYRHLFSRFSGPERTHQGLDRRG
ncbi:hypothetical protein [Corynebacterium heidelbergense]|uniref:hypothetical protein n=1 Tax=Corynebacterium heidelbergense TaxID=2055947 RepID=UPI0010582BA9|nr:hypothetical protein [Corynebacterium heidelbergense]